MYLYLCIPLSRLMLYPEDSPHVFFFFQGVVPQKYLGQHLEFHNPRVLQFTKKINKTQHSPAKSRIQVLLQCDHPYHHFQNPCIFLGTKPTYVSDTWGVIHHHSDKLLVAKS